VSTTSWFRNLKGVVARNRPSRKPQLWEDPLLALRRRVRLEISRRTSESWLDAPHVGPLSEVGFPAGVAPPELQLVPREMTNRGMFLYGTFEISETRLLQALLQPGMTFVDVGANIGYYTVIAGRLVGPGGAVHAFEPNLAMRGRLAENVRLNGLGNVVIHAEALAGHTGQVDFYASTTEANQGISSIIPGAGRDARQSVPCFTLDDYWPTLGQPLDVVMKMDIEGAEREVLAAGQRTLTGPAAPPLIFEAAELGPVAEVLRGSGYHIRRIHYRLETGLELTEPGASFDDLFAAYEAPNYFAAKDDSLFDRVLARANANRPLQLRMLGRV